MKTFRKILKSALSAAIITTAFSSCNTNYKNTLQIQAMNTYMTVQTYGIKSAKVNNLIRDRISMIENNISVTKENSDLYRLNNSNGKITAISRDTELLLNHSKQFYEITDNSFNPALYPIIKEWGFTTEEYKIPDDRKIQSLLQNTDFSKIEINPDATTNSPTAYLPSGMMIDFGAIGKGYASDEICKILSQNKIKNALIDLGGNIHTYGTKPDGTLWNIGIKNPNTGNPFASIKTRDMAVITSGGYERYFVGPDQKTYIHIFNPKTGRPVEGELASVTIVCPSGLYGDTLSTALFVMGAEKACEFWKNNPDFEFIFFFKDSSVWYSEGLKENLHIFDEINSTKMIISDK